MHAYDHGFTYENVGAPVIIGDGLFGEHDVQIEINQKMCKYAHVAGVAMAANVIVSIAHVTGHLATGLGATLKNIGMGLSARGGKLAQHSGVIPQILNKKCTVCGVCNKWCPVGAIKWASSMLLLTQSYVSDAENAWPYANLMPLKSPGTKVPSISRKRLPNIALLFCRGSGERWYFSIS